MAITGHVAAGFLEARGWTYYQNPAWNLEGWRHPHLGAGQMPLTIDAAIEVQRGWMEAEQNARMMKRPSYHWGLEAALAMGCKA